MIELKEPVEFLETIMNTFPKYFWGNNSDEVEAWIGIRSIAQVRFECRKGTCIHLFLNSEHKMSGNYPVESQEEKLIRQLICQTRRYFLLPRNSSYQNFYSTVLIKQSEQIIKHYFRENNNG